MTTPPARNPLKLPLLAAMLIILLLAGGLTTYYIQVNSIENSNSNKITNLQNQITNLQNQINILLAQIAQLRGALTLRNSTTLFSGSVGPIQPGAISTQSLTGIAYAGYLQMNYTANGLMHIEVDCTTKNSNTATTSPVRVSGTNIIAPVIPNSTCTINYWNDDSVAVTATVTVRYVY
jgi:hypothetical protein